ncbi:MAG: excinuclease ABC subunit UvrC [Planctomycetota bacterium]
MSEDPQHREALLAKIGRFPAEPGVYVMKDAAGKVLYVGKAVNLRSRVRSYFGTSPDSRCLSELLVAKVADVDPIVTASETEALILENNLIKKHRPLYNIRLRDDKSYVSIKVTTAERWPRVLVTRRYRKDGNLYFGPFGSAGSVRELLRVVKAAFPLRTCSNAFFQGRSRPCIEHEIGRCSAPCVGLTTREAYLQHVDAVVLLLKGRNRELLDLLDARMREASSARRYELAARYRDQRRAVEKVFERQKVQEWGLGDLDVFALAREGQDVQVEELLVREGKVIHSSCRSFRTSLADEEVLASFLAQYYLAERYLPKEILCDRDFPERGILESWLAEKRGGRVKIRVPRHGEKAEILELARKNALAYFQVARSEEERTRNLLEALGERLGLDAPPRAIECFDVSNFQGDLAVGALVRFEDGRPAKERYRKYRIRTVVGADDFRCLGEVLERRLRRGVESGDLPDLIVVDGGKGQLAVAEEAIDRWGVRGRLAAIALAKERRSRGTAERIFVPGRSQPLPLGQESPESLLLQRIRDEAHRFAVRYHRELRKRETLRTGLEGVPGIGPKRRRAILDRFGTLRRLREAAEDEVASVVGRKLARVLLERLQRPDAEPPPEEISGEEPR